MRRRDLVFGGAVLPLLGTCYGNPPVEADVPPETVLPDGATFDAATVRQLARLLAQKPYKAPDVSLPETLKNLTYDRVPTRSPRRQVLLRLSRPAHGYLMIPPLSTRTGPC